MTIRDPGPEVKPDLSFGHSLVDLGVPVFHARLTSDGAPHRAGWEKVRPSHGEVDGWRRGQALCAHTGVKFDVLDVDPRHGGADSYRELRRRLGDDPEIYAKVRTRSGGLHLYVPPLGLGTKHPVPGYPGIDLQGRGAMVFIPPTVRLGGRYELKGSILDELDGAVRQDRLAQLLATPTADVADPDGAGRHSTTELWARVLSAPEGAQRDALLKWVDELEKRYEREDAIAMMMAMRHLIPVYDKAKPWRESDLRGLLHAPGEIIPDGREEELLDQPGISRQQAKENLLALRRERARMFARDSMASEQWREPPGSMSLADQRKNPPEPVKYTIDQIVTCGSKNVIVAGYKTGKTTLAIDMAVCLAGEKPWLGAYDVDFPDGRVGYWNIELDEAMMFEWMDRRASRAAASRMVVANLRGYPVNLLSPVAARWAVSWLNQWDVRFWFLDPLGRNLEDENSNSELNRLWLAIESVVRDTPVESVFLVHHSGHGVAGDDGVVRSRGASAIPGGTDANFSLRHTGNPGEMPPDDVRYLSGMGRGVMLPEIGLSYNPAGGVYSLVEGSVPRSEARLVRLAEAAREALALGLVNCERDYLTYKELEALVPVESKYKSVAIREAISRGIIRAEPMGPGKPTKHFLKEE